MYPYYRPTLACHRHPQWTFFLAPACGRVTHPPLSGPGVAHASTEKKHTAYLAAEPAWICARETPYASCLNPQCIRRTITAFPLAVSSRDHLRIRLKLHASVQTGTWHARTPLRTAPVRHLPSGSHALDHVLIFHGHPHAVTKRARRATPPPHAHSVTAAACVDACH